MHSYPQASTHILCLGNVRKAFVNTDYYLLQSQGNQSIRYMRLYKHKLQLTGDLKHEEEDIAEDLCFKN